MSYQYKKNDKDRQYKIRNLNENGVPANLH